MPHTWALAQPRVVPQLWSLEKIFQKQAELVGGVVLPYCGVNGEESPLHPSMTDFGVVVVCDFSLAASVCETPVLSRDLQQWALNDEAPRDWVSFSVELQVDCRGSGVARYHSSRCETVENGTNSKKATSKHFTGKRTFSTSFEVTLVL